MSYVVLARKYRPRHFDEVVGQGHITRILKNALSAERVAHAYLFCGPRGIGKTSCARILAKSLNCVNGPTLKPCNECPACKEINQGNSFDVLEIDGASNRGIDEIRTLRENVKFAPGSGRYKIYIVDEVHMLTTEAFNALLKTLEEPPAHVKFIFATTDPNKVPSTIISRCQRYDFKRLSLKQITETLCGICENEGFKVDSDALYAIAKAAQGSLRDALSILDQVSALTDHEIHGADVFGMLGLVVTEDLFNLTDELARCDCAKALDVLNAIIDKGKDIKQLTKDLLEHYRNLLVIKIGGKTLGRLVDYPIAVKEMYLAQSRQYSLAMIMRAIDLLIETHDVARVTELSRIPLEIAFAKLTMSQDSGGQPEAGSARPFSRAARTTPKAVDKPTARLRVNNEKGSVDISGAGPEHVPLDPDMSDDHKHEVDAAPIPAFLDLAEIRRVWDTLTYAVSRKRISVATYLQEGFPLDFHDQTLTVGFTPEHEFHKSVLESKENIVLVETIFGEKLRRSLRIKYQLVETQDRPAPLADDKIVHQALETFKGTIVNKWHKQ